MVTVITYGTYDLLHYGHRRLLERAKALGDYLIVGVTSDDFDKRRGKINSNQPLEERIDAVRKTGLVDKIIVEEYEGQKIDDIKKYGADIFTVGSDWEGHFDYLNEFCKVVYLPRTEGISSSERRSKLQEIRVGIVGSAPNLIEKFIRESKCVNGVKISGIFTKAEDLPDGCSDVPRMDSLSELYEKSDAVYISSNPENHYSQIKTALLEGKDVLCESPITRDSLETKELFELAENNSLILQEGIKTAYSVAYERLMLLLKSNIIGEVVSVKSTCTSLSTDSRGGWSGIEYWAPTAMLPGFQLFGTEYTSRTIVKKKDSDGGEHVTILFVYPQGTVTVSSGNGIKSEGDLVISGKKGYIYVPAPWWKTDYFEARFENPADNRKYYYQLDGEGIRYEIVDFVHSINSKKSNKYIENDVSVAISKVLEDIKNSTGIIEL